MFLDNFTTVCEAGINVQPLLESEIFLFRFDYDPWPGLHGNDKEIQKPYHGSIFQLRYAYNQVFDEPEFDEDRIVPGERVFKVSYSMNLLPQFFTDIYEVGNSKLMEGFRDGDCTLMGTPKLDYFNTEAIQ